MGNAEMIDTMIKDGLWDIFNGYHMGVTAENVARQWQITRDEQDEFAAGLAAEGRGRASRRASFKDEIVPVKIMVNERGDMLFDTDEFPRAGTTERGAGQAASPPSPRTAP